MRTQSPKSIKLATLSMAFFLSASCSKDTDLLADYVVSEATQARVLGNLVADDYYYIGNNKSIVLDVLSNDLFENPEMVSITEISSPTNGTVTINEDKTLTYIVGENPKTSEEKEKPENEEITEETETPEPNEIPKEKPSAEGTDLTEETDDPINESITYTIETENEDGTTDTQQGKITITNEYGELKAFPTAEGFGKYTTGGRGGNVIHVTNLNDKGPGSLREALYAKGKRTVVFDVSGYIDLNETISIRNPDITIAGQTAPGEGITIRGGTISIQASNVIIRYLRIRPGYNAADGSDCINIRAHKDNLNITGIIIDHCSLSWSLDENLAFDANPMFENNSIKNATVQNCINAEALKYYAVLMGRNLSRISIIQNLFAHVDNRIPESTYGNTPESYEFNNNIIYNYGRPTVIAYGVEVDVIGNIYKTKETPLVPNIQYSKNNIENPYGKATDGKIFQIDNIQVGTNPKGMTNGAWDENNQSSRNLSNSPYNIIPAADLERALLPNVGASIFDDPVDSRIILEYMSNTGKRGPKNETQVGGYPNLTKTKHSKGYDTDSDGISNEWELNNGLDPKNAADGGDDRNGDGYTNLEDFLHYLTLP